MHAVANIVSFVLPMEYRRRFWPELCTENPQHETVLSNPHRFVWGIDAWIVQTWALLAAKSDSVSVRLVERGQADCVNVFHYDHATPHNGVHLGFSVVVRADRPPVPLCDIAVEQNPIVSNSLVRRYMPFWPQPGMIPRNVKRGVSVRSLAYVGSDMYLPKYMRSGKFVEALAQMGVEFKTMLNGNWYDYSDVDVLVAVRNVPESVLLTKPASKLTNSWLAGCPIVVNDEPAYRALRRSSLDYLVAHDEDEVLRAVSKLVNDMELYNSMLRNCEERRHEHSQQSVVDRWVDLLRDIPRPEHYSRVKTASRFFQYYIGKIRAKIWSVLHSWND